MIIRNGIMTLKTINKIDQLNIRKRQNEKEYLLELYHNKKCEHSKFDFQSLLDKEMEKLNEMSDVRRIKVGGRRYKLKPLTLEQKKVVTKNNRRADDWLFLSDSDSYMRIVRKDSLEGNLKIETIYK